MYQYLAIIGIAVILVLGGAVAGVISIPGIPKIPLEPSVCGNDICEWDEDHHNCPEDCHPSCGNAHCDWGETIENCPEDCDKNLPYCGDNVCDAYETYTNCPDDCEAYCGDGICSNELGEYPHSCPEDCVWIPPECGNGNCDSGEDWANCYEDCPAICGDGACQGFVGETWETCPIDCDNPCGNGYCEIDESYETCPQDCPLDQGYCGDEYCAFDETQTICPKDCGCPSGYSLKTYEQFDPYFQGMTGTLQEKTSKIQSLCSDYVGTINTGTPYYKELNWDGDISAQCVSMVGLKEQPIFWVRLNQQGEISGFAWRFVRTYYKSPPSTIYWDLCFKG